MGTGIEIEMKTEGSKQENHFSISISIYILAKTWLFLEKTKIHGHTKTNKYMDVESQQIKLGSHGLIVYEYTCTKSHTNIHG